MVDGDDDLSTAARASRIEAHLEAVLNELAAVRVDVEASLLDLVPPYAEAFESRREALDARIDRIREDLNDLDQRRGRAEQLRATRSTIRSRRAVAKKAVSDRIQELEDELFDLEAEREARRDKRDRIRGELSALRRSLSEAETARQLAVLPIDLDALDRLAIEATADVDETLSSIADYVTHGLVDADVAEEALTQAVGLSTAWEDPTLTPDDAGADDGSDRPRELLGLYAEANAELLDSLDVASDADRVRLSGSDLRSLSDTYRVEFVSFAGGSLTSSPLYRELDDVAEAGALAELRGPYDDWRQAFAYPEWYGRDIQEAFDIVSQISVPRPPEPDPDSIDADDPDSTGSGDLDAYLWEGDRWAQYVGAGRFEGWKYGLSRNAVSFSEFRAAEPSEPLSQWLAGRAEWDTVVDAYCEKLADEVGVELQIR